MMTLRFFRFAMLLLAVVGAISILSGWSWFSRERIAQFSGSELSWSGKQESEKQEPMPSNKAVTVLFGGDLQFDRYIRSVTERRGGTFLFDGLRTEFQKVDLIVANLEGPITDKPSVSKTSLEGSHDNYVFTFPPETAGLLRQENINLVNIGNNHILNFKEEGVRQTKEFLRQAGVDYFGSPLVGDDRTSIKTISGVRLGFVNYNEFVWQGRKKVLDDIASVTDQVDFIIVYSHWGKEYVAATDEVKVLAREFIDAGADLVIGSHPHVIQEIEEYRGKRIYYSLGNLIFDQYFQPETMSGLVVRAEFDQATKSIGFSELPISLKTNGQTEFIPR